MLRFKSPCLVYSIENCVHFHDKIQFNGEDSDSSFRDQLEPEYSSHEERRENESEAEEESNSLLANLGTHDRFLIDALLCRLRGNFFEKSSIR